MEDEVASQEFELSLKVIVVTAKLVQEIFMHTRAYISHALLFIDVRKLPRDPMLHTPQKEKS